MGFCDGYETRNQKKRTFDNMTQVGFCHGYETRSKKNRYFDNITQSGLAHGSETRNRSKKAKKDSSSTTKMDMSSNIPEGVKGQIDMLSNMLEIAKGQVDMLSNMPEGAKEQMDMLSNLPEGVRGQVLSYLPIKDAARTSILSRDWRHTWTSIPGLVICDVEIIFSDNPRKVGYYRLVKSVDTITVIHNGSVREGNLDNVINLMQVLMVNGDIMLESSPLLDFNGVKNIEFLKLNFGYENEAAFVLALILRASHLQSLFVHVNFAGERAAVPVTKFWETIDSRRRKGHFGSNLFKYLHTVNIAGKGIKAAESILSFLGFVMPTIPHKAS